MTFVVPTWTGARRLLLPLAAAIGVTLGSAYGQLDAVAVPPWSDPTGYAEDCLAVGAFVGEGPAATVGPLFLQASEVMGPFTVRRSFDQTIPETFAASAAADDERHGLRSFVSWKPPGDDRAGVVAGRYDAAIVRWARSVPPGVWGTSFHEPENDMTAAEFVAYHRHVYGLVKEANPTIRWGPVYMAYWWDPGEPSHYVGDPAAWWPGEEYADFVGLDWYGPRGEPMTGSASFRHWYAVMEPTDLPLYVVEYGQYAVDGQGPPDPAGLRARSAAIRADAAWIAAHPRIRMWVYWQATGAQGDWRIRDEEGRQAWRSVADSGCSPATAAAAVAPPG